MMPYANVEAVEMFRPKLPGDKAVFLYFTIVSQVDLFKKAYDFTRADDVKAAGYYPYFHAFDANEGPVVHLDGRKIIMAGSNNYLGLTIDPRVKEAAIKAINQYGTGCSGSRY